MPKVSQAHRVARRAQILDAAMRCFARVGFHRTTMQDIVREANLSFGAIYLYFASKEEIIAALADERHAHEQRLIAEAGGSDSLAETLHRLAQAFFGPLQTPDERLRRRLGIQIWAEALGNEQLLALMRRGVDAPRKLLTERLANAQRRGDFPTRLDPEVIARMLIALFHGFILQHAWDERLPIEPYVATIEGIFQALLEPASAPQPRNQGDVNERARE
jgi:AcrR family transcriptional regulator